MRLLLDARLDELLEQEPLAAALERCELSAHENVTRAAARASAASNGDFTAARVRTGFARGHLLDVVVYVPGFSGGDAERVCAEPFVEGVLGARLSRAWIGEVSAEPGAGNRSLRVVSNAASGAFPVTELPSAVVAAVRGLYSGLPETRCSDEPESDDWTMLELTPEPAPDYGAQDDLVLATSRRPEMLTCFLRGLRFCSERFSRHGELFCYLKYRSAHAAAEARLAERSEFEDCLQGALGAHGLGAIVGNGLGLRYAYLDFALNDVPRALATIAEVARARGVARDSWLLFCDSDLSEHWFEVGPNAGRPFGAK